MKSLATLAWRSLWRGVGIAGKRTLREAMVNYCTSGQSIDLVGTPDQVACQMEEIMQDGSGEGFLFSLPNVRRRTTVERPC